MLWKLRSPHLVFSSPPQGVILWTAGKLSSQYCLCVLRGCTDSNFFQINCSGCITPSEKKWLVKYRWVNLKITVKGLLSNSPFSWRINCLLMFASSYKGSDFIRLCLKCIISCKLPLVLCSFKKKHFLTVFMLPFICVLWGRVKFCFVLMERKVTSKTGKAISDPEINQLNFLNQIKYISL